MAELTGAGSCLRTTTNAVRFHPLPRSITPWLLFPLVALAPLRSAVAGTVMLTPMADSYMEQFHADENFGSANNMIVGEVGSRAMPPFEIRRGLLRFDLSSLPAGAVVNSATLQISAVLMLPQDPVNSDFGIHLLLEDWDELAVSWNSPLAGVSWTAPGASDPADTVQAPSSTVFVTGLGNYVFPTTPSLISDVQAWVNDPRSNFGWLLVSEENGPESARHIGTREDISGNAPVLTIDFSLPPPIIVTNPASQSVTVGSTVSFSVKAIGPPPLSYQW